MVNIWKEKVNIPTYKTGDYEKYPMFFEKRVYQGSSGVVYPYPIIEKIYDEKSDKLYDAVFIENEFIKVMVLPELGGRVQMAWDKIKQRHFVYHNSVIKPALVGLTGPWISGGIEFNWPQHHRPSTFLPVDCQTETSEDGSCTIWVNETEKMNYQRCMTGFTLYPGKAYLEVKVKLYNSTALPQTFLWWANPAVAVNDYYQSVFPPDVKAVYDHGKRDVSSFPLATGKYYKIDYSKGVDISMYKNIPVPTSFMAVNSKYDFIGGYEHDKKVGMIHLANHRISPGKKLWTWGNSDFGRVWNQHLTDTDGPYIELMAGVYTDNQPDFSWLQPYEEKSFSQYFIPYSGLGIIKNATKDLLLNVEEVGTKVVVSLQSTSAMAKLQIVLGAAFYEQINLNPGEIYTRDIAKLDTEPVSVKILDEQGKLLLEYLHEDKESTQIPDVAQPARMPQTISSCEEAYLTGLHLEQYRHAHLDPTIYYQRALELDPTDSRNNNAMGLWLLRRARFGESAIHFNRAITSLKRFNPNPSIGEAFYHLGLALAWQGSLKEAYDAFYKATWNAGIQDAAWFECAKISSVEGRYADALAEVNNSLIRNSRNYKALGLKTILLRKTGQTNTAKTFAAETLCTDPFHTICHFEEMLLTGNTKNWDDLLQNKAILFNNLETAAFDYASFGFYSEALQLLQEYVIPNHNNAWIEYTKAWIEQKNGLNSSQTLAKAFASTHEYCFPNRLETVGILSYALNQNPSDYKAHYYFGNFWYDKKQYELASEHWQKAVELQPRFAAALRNLAIYTFNQQMEAGKAAGYMEAAFRFDPTSARLLLELDQLARLMNKPAQQRRELLLQHFRLVQERDDLYLELVTLLNLTGEYDEAIKLLEVRKFHPWEGGEGKVLEQFRISRISKALRYLQNQETGPAISLLTECLNPPDSIGEAKLPLPQDQDIYFYIGLGNAMNGNTQQALSCWQLATQGEISINEAFFYNDIHADRVFYQAQAWSRIGEKLMAEKLYRSLIEYGVNNYLKPAALDYFTVSFPYLSNWDIDLKKSNQVHCLYLQGLGYFGLGMIEKARNALLAAITIETSHQGAQLHYNLITKYTLLNPQSES